MSKQKGVVYDDVKKSVDAVINQVGKEIVFGMPLALGKPVRFVNELYRRAKEDSTIKLKIVTALALEKPRGASDLEKRIIEPLADRIFEGFPDFDYMNDFRAGKMPENIELYEFFNKAGGYMGSPVAQQNHLNSNYTHVIRDAIDFGVNVYGQMLARREVDGQALYSMGCNTDISIEAIKEIDKLRAAGKKVSIVAEVNENLPFMYGDAIVAQDAYDVVISSEECNYPLFGPPKDAVSLKDHMIGLNVSTLLKDGGTIQVGIGALGDAIVAGLQMRQEHNEDYNKVVEEVGIAPRYQALIDRIGGTDRFEQGLYGSSEMFVDAFMQLYKSGILKRKVFDNVELMELINDEKISADEINGEIIDLLIEKKAIGQTVSEEDFNFLTEFGILKEGLSFEGSAIRNGASSCGTDLTVPENLDALKAFLGDSLRGGTVILGAFFLGPRDFYHALNAMSEEERMQFGMSGVDKVNQLYGDEKLRTLQRKDGRFINTGMMANIYGAITSDALDDGRVVSGIGGQYNFVSMAHALPDGRLIMMVRSTRGTGSQEVSSIVYNYGHCSVPKHLRDIIVTEYGIADVRGKADKDVILEILKVTDSRFQDELLAKAKEAGKVPAHYEIPEEYRNNTPERINALLKPYQEKGYFKTFPFGTDITDEEVVLGGSLRAFKAKAAESKVGVAAGLIKELTRPVPEKAMPYLKRMQLENVSSFKEKMLQKVVIFALKSNGKI